MQNILAYGNIEIDRKQVSALPTKERLDQKHLEDLERPRRFHLMDDDFLTKCFEGDTVCIQLVLRIVLEIPDLEVTEVRTQVFVENLLNRSVRLDVVARDGENRVINVEIQRQDRGVGRKRARYNSSMMDANLLKKGEDFDQLPEVYVVFITEHDVFGKGRPLYRIDRYFDTSECFDDGSHILYVNGAYRGETPLGKLMHDFSCTDPSDMYYDVLAERVRFFKESREGAIIMCKMMEDMRNESLREGLERGMQQDMQQGMNAAALRMLGVRKYTLEEVAEISGLSLDAVKKLQAERVS